MSQDKIRLHYTGLIAFSARMFSILTGFIFVVFVTRNVPSADFGVWQFLSLLISYIMFPMGGINYFATRDAARGVQGATKTCVVLNLAISLVGVALFSVLSQPWAEFLNTNPLYFLVGSLTVLVMAAITSLEAVAYGSMPHIPSYGFIAFELTKVLCGVVTILFWGMGLLGALLSVFLAYFIQAIVLIIFLREKLKEGINHFLAIKWLKTLWLPITSNFVTIISSLDVAIMMLLVKSTEPLAYLKAAQVVATTISYSSFMASALYPKLLRGHGEKDIESALRLVMMVGLPMTAGAMTLATPLLRILQHQYAVAAPILIILAMSTFLNSLFSIMNNIITGTEKVDLEDHVSFNKVIRSRLFFPVKVSYTTTIAYIIGMFTVSIYLANSNFDSLSLQLPLAAAIVGFVTTLPAFAYTWTYAKKAQPFRFPLRSFVKQLIATVAMVIVVQFFYPTLFIETLCTVFYGFLTYIIVLVLIDRDVRTLIHAILNEVRAKLRRKS